ncbi:hypothetical protein [Thomasclavelia saccharogumia]|uniref:hypothetical protein n=1 Tax=Thomasclavelia saccharogumia TaxID=341225 RepID=UPI00047CE4FB|nr:hypothetical protein [Thomasclavelia saccharogumia]
MIDLQKMFYENQFAINGILSLINICSVIINVYIGYKNYKITEKKEMPCLMIERVQSTPCQNKRKNGVTLINGYYHRRFYHDIPYLDDLTINGNVPINELDRNKLSESLNRVSNVYFHNFNNHLGIVFNLLNPSGSQNDREKHIVLDQSMVIVKVKNIGNTITSLLVRGADITYVNGNHRHLSGLSKSLNKILRTNDSLYLGFDEITNNFIDSICKISRELYETLVYGTDLDSIPVNPYILNYIEIGIELEICTQDGRYLQTLYIKKNEDLQEMEYGYTKPVVIK